MDLPLLQGHPLQGLHAQFPMGINKSPFSSSEEIATVAKVKSKLCVWNALCVATFIFANFVTNGCTKSTKWFEAIWPFLAERLQRAKDTSTKIVASRFTPWKLRTLLLGRYPNLNGLPMNSTQHVWDANQVLRFSNEDIIADGVDNYCVEIVRLEGNWKLLSTNTRSFSNFQLS